MRVYFNGLMNLTYQKVSIQSTELASIKVSNLQKLITTCMFALVILTKYLSVIGMEDLFIKTLLVKGKMLY